MPRLKGVILSLRDVILREGSIDQKLLEELAKLLRWIESRGVVPIIVSNNPWVSKQADGTTVDVETILNEHWFKAKWFIASRGDMPYKPQASAMETVLSAQGWEPHEALYIGNTDVDMRTARNGKLLFLNAVWHGEANSYGYVFSSPKDVARFIDTFCLSIDDWYWAIERGDLRVFAIAPFSTLSARFADAQAYSSNARSTAKHLGGDANFWGLLLSTQVYLSGLAAEIDYVTAYPGHSSNSPQQVIADALQILGDSLRANFIPDLIVRHSTATKSQTARTSGGTVNKLNQLNTIHLNQYPIRKRTGERYANSPLGRGKTVLVVDDFCTEGNSLEAARAYIESTGAKAVLLSWLKTINTNYGAIRERPVLQPFQPNTLTTEPAVDTYYFSSQVKNSSAMRDLNAVFSQYYTWDWPAKI